MRVVFGYNAIQIKWFGTHAEYDHPVPLPDPIEAIKLKMLEKGLKNKDLVGKVGGPKASAFTAAFLV